MLLSKDARSDAIPGLEIDETEVQAGHAATTGQSRSGAPVLPDVPGAAREEAMHLLVVGFFDQVVARMPSRAFRKSSPALIDRKMSG